jgi:hypothetical protein
VLTRVDVLFAGTISVGSRFEAVGFKLDLMVQIDWYPFILSDLLSPLDRDPMAEKEGEGISSPRVSCRRRRRGPRLGG